MKNPDPAARAIEAEKQASHPKAMDYAIETLAGALDEITPDMIFDILDDFYLRTARYDDSVDLELTYPEGAQVDYFGREQNSGVITYVYSRPGDLELKCIERNRIFFRHKQTANERPALPGRAFEEALFALHSWIGKPTSEHDWKKR